jgi:hypothetical protein
MNSTTANKYLNPAWKINMTPEEKFDFDRISSILKSCEDILKMCDEESKIMDFSELREATEVTRRHFLKRVGQRITEETGT